MTVTGVLGQPWRGDVTAHGSIEPWDGGPALDWHVAADDRWHSPSHEVAARQRRIEGAPVLETRLRIPGGDAVQHVWSIADAGGLTCVRVANESPLPIACAFTRSDLLTARPPTAVPVQGIELPTTTIVLPIAHRTSVTVALAHDRSRAGRLPERIPDPEAVARGWVAMTERASRLDVPASEDVERVVAARCDLLLDGPPDPDVDAVGFLLGVVELVRMGELAADEIVPTVADAAERAARCAGWEADAALDAAAVVLAAAGERRALADLCRITSPRIATPVPSVPPDGPAAVAAVERRLLRGCTLFPDGIPAPWRGANLEAHGLAAGPRSRLSFAVRWHGANPAVLWELDGDPVELAAPAVDPSWRTTAAKGEALWHVTSAP